MIRLWAGDPNSVIDRENGKIFLRSMGYPKRSWEWVIYDGVIEINTVKRNGIATEIFQISDISKMTLKVGVKTTTVTLEIEGKKPKKWFRGVLSAGVDIFVAYAAYEYILEKRQGDQLNPIETKIPSHIPEMARMLRAGELDPEAIADFKARGMSW